MIKMTKKVKNKFSSVSLPINLIKKIKEQIKGTGFTSVSSYVEYILREILVEKASRKEREKREAEKKEKEQVFNSEGEEKVKERLRALGYL